MPPAASNERARTRVCRAPAGGTDAWRLAALLLSAVGLAGCTPMVDTAPGAEPYPYELTLPAAYAARPGERFPLIVYLHGAGGPNRGDHPIQAYARGRADFPFILLAPRTADDWDAARLAAVLGEARRRVRIDPDRVYLTGISRGAFGAFRFAAAHPARFAALALVAGGGEPENACRIRHLPVRFFHNRADPVVPVVYSEELAAALRACGAERVRVDVFEAAEPGRSPHDAWTAAYGDSSLYEWFLEHRRGSPRGGVRRGSP